MFLLALHLHYFFLFSHFCYFPCLHGDCAFTSKGCQLRDPELLKLAQKLPCVPLKQRLHQQRSINIQDPFENLENGHLALRKSFACPLMTCQ